MPEQRNAFGDLIVSDQQEEEQPATNEFGDPIARPRAAVAQPGVSGEEPEFPPGLEEPSDAEVAKMFGQKPEGFWGGLVKGAGHPFGSTAKGVGIPFLSDDILKQHLQLKRQETEGALLPPTKAGRIGEVVGGLGGTLVQAGLTHLAAARGGALAQKAALGATFGSATAYDEFVRAGTNALREGKDIDEALKIAKTSSAIAAPLGAALGVVTPPGAGQALTLRRALTASGAMGAMGAGLPLVENIVQRAQGLKTPVTEGVLESGATMGALPVGLYGLSKAVGLVPRAFQALRGGEPKPKAPGEPPPLPRAAEELPEVEYLVDGQPVELIEANPDKGVALVRMPDGNTRSVGANDLIVRRKGEANAREEQQAAAAVSGLPTQSRLGEGQVPAQKGGRRVPGATTPKASGEVSLKLRQEALDAVNELTQAKAAGATPEQLAQLEGKLGQAMQKAETSMDVDDLVGLELAVTRAQRAPAPVQRPTGFTPEQQTQYNDVLDNLIGIVTRAKEQGKKTSRDVYSAARGKGEEEQAQSGVYDILKVVGGENERMGLPHQFIQVNLPAGVGNRAVAWTGKHGEMVINWRELLTWLHDMPKERRMRALKAVFTEEGIHSLALGEFTPEEMTGLWRGLTGVERALVRKSYTGSFKGRGPEGQTFTEAQMGHEYLRRVMQRALRGELSERAEGINRISQGAIDMIERVIIALRRLVNRSPELDAMVNRLEQVMGDMREGYASENAGEGGPQAFRRGKRPPPQEQEGLNLLPPTGEGGATIADIIPVTPAKLSGAITANIAGARPSFAELVKSLKVDFPGITTEQLTGLKEEWRGALWNKLMNAPGKELETLRDQLKLRERVTTGTIAEPPARRPEFALETQGASREARQQLRAEQRATGATSPAQKARANAIARIGEQLSREADLGEAKSLTRATVTPDEMGWRHEVEGKEPALRRISPDESRPQNLENLGRILTSGAAMDRTKRGGKRLPDTATKRVTVLVDTQTGEVHKVGTYRTKEGVYIVDPTAPGKEGVPLARLLQRKSGGPGTPPRYKPVYSILLDSPVKKFRQSYPAWNRFREGFLDAAERDNLRRQQSADQAAALEVAMEDLSAERKKALGIPPKHPGMLLAGDRLTRPEADALLNHLNDEALDVQSLQDVRDAVASLSQKATAGTLKGRDWQTINALRKEVLKTERNNPELKGTNEAVEKTIERIFGEVQAAKSGEDFANRLGALAESVPGGVEAEPAPSGPGARELELPPGQPEAAQATRAYHTRIGKFGEFPEPGPRTPEPPGSLAAERARMAESRKGLDQWLKERRKLSPSYHQETQAFQARQRDPNAYTDVDVAPGDAPLAFRRPRPVRAGTDILAWYAEWMIPRLIRVSEDSQTRGFFTRFYARQFNRAISRQHELYGGLTRWLDPAKQMAGGGFVEGTPLSQIPREMWGNLRAATWANGITRVAGTRTAQSNFHEAMEGRMRAPSYADRAMAAWQEANQYIGEMLEPVIPGFRAGGAVQRNLTAFGLDVIRRGTGRVWEDWTRGLAAASGRSVARTRDFFTRWKEVLDNAAQDPAAAERVNQDFIREFNQIVTHVEVDTPLGGHWEPVVHATPFNYLEAAAQRAAHLRAFREEFPVNPANGRNDTWQRAYEQLQSEIPGDYHPDLEGVARALNGHPTDSYAGFAKGILAPDSSLGNMMRAANQTVGNIMAKLVLTGQVPTQIPETVTGATPIFLGGQNYLRGLARTRQLYTEMEQNGQVNRLIYDWAFNPNQPVRSATRILGNAISVGSRQNWLNEFQEFAAAATARVVRERIEAGAMSPWERSRIGQTFKAMGFSAAEARRMLVPGAEPALLTQFERKAASWLTSGNKVIAEGSRLGANRLFNSIFRFQSYPMMKVNQLRRSTGQMLETFRDPNATSAERASSVRLLGRFLGGTAAQGALMAGVGSLFYNGIFGLKVTSQEAIDQPAKFLAESFISALGGPLYLAWRAGMQNGHTGIDEQVLRTMFPYSVATSLMDFATGNGPYKDVDPLDRREIFLEKRVPGTRMLRTGMAMFGLGEKDEKLKVALRAFYRWRGEKLGWSKTERDIKNDTAEGFRVEMKKAVQALQKGDRVRYREALKAASGAHRQALKEGNKSTLTSPQAIARSLRARRVLEDVEGRKLNRKELAQLRARVGDDAYKRLRYYDLMLSAAADGIQMRPMP